MSWQNSAARLLRFFSRLQLVNSVNGACAALEIPPETPELLLKKLGELASLVQEFEADARSKARTQNEQERWLSVAKLARQCLFSARIRMDMPHSSVNSFRIAPIPQMMFNLGLISDSLGDELNLSDEIQQLRDCLSNLQSILRESETLPPTVKRWLQDVVRILRDTLDRYDTFGARGMKRHFNELVGQLAYTWQTDEDVRKSKEITPGLWEQVDRAFTILERVVFVVENGKPMLSYVGQLLLPAILK